MKLVFGKLTHKATTNTDWGYPTCSNMDESLKVKKAGHKYYRLNTLLCNIIQNKNVRNQSQIIGSHNLQQKIDCTTQKITLLFKMMNFKLGLVAQTCRPNAQEEETRGFQGSKPALTTECAAGQTELHGEPLLCTVNFNVLGLCLCQPNEK